MARRTTTRSDSENNGKKRTLLNPTDTNFSGILHEQRGESDIADFLNSLGIYQPGDLSASQRTDWNKQLLDTLTNYKLTQENREYNEGLRDEQRIYDNPISQLARLMGAGISRDQAIQMLSSGGSGSGGSGVPYSDPSSAAEGIAPSQSHLNAVQATQVKLQTGLGFVNAISGLVGLGFHAAQVIPQVKMLKNQEYLNSKQKSSFDDVNTAFSIIANSGKGITPDTFGSIGSICSTLTALSKSGDAAAKSFIDSGGLDRLTDNSSYCLPIANEIFRNEKDSSYYVRSVEAALRKDETQANLNLADADLAMLEQDEVAAKVDNLNADTEFINGRTALQSWEQKQYAARISSLKAAARLSNSTANQIDLSNKVESSFLNHSENGLSGLDLITNHRFASLKRGLYQLNAEIGSKVWEKQIKTFLLEQDNLQSAYTLSTLYNKGELDIIENAKPKFRSYLYMSRALDSCGVSSFINSIIQSETSNRVNGITFREGKSSSILDNIIDSSEPESTPLFKRMWNYIQDKRDAHKTLYGH